MPNILLLPTSYVSCVASDLKVTKYRNGDPIIEISGDADWSVLTTDAYCNMNNDENFAAIYGRLYNWQAVHDNRNIAPERWHLVSFEKRLSDRPSLSAA
jgi:hypothetical protein